MVYDSSNWLGRALNLFVANGFVVIENVLTVKQQREVLRDCELAAEKIVGPNRVGNRGPGRYSFGKASSSGGMLHLKSFAHYLLNGGCYKLLPLLVKIFEKGAKRGFQCFSAGGDFVVRRTISDQHIHSDFGNDNADVLLPPPFVSINFTVQELTITNGAIRIIPGTQLYNGKLPTNTPDAWFLSRLYPVPAGAAIIRDVRTLHSGTPNLSGSTRYLPSVEFVSNDFVETRDPSCFPAPRSLSRDHFLALKPPLKKLCRGIVHSEKISQWYRMSE